MSTSGSADLACTFCGRPQSNVSKLIAGPHTYICDACVELAERVATSGTAADTRLGRMHAVEEDGHAPCSFCGKQRGQVTGMAAMPVESSGKFLGSPAGLSAAVITRLTEQWQAEQRAVAARDLSAVDYLFALVRAGARFERGILVERHDRAAA